jgi:hypothetical protein
MIWHSSPTRGKRSPPGKPCSTDRGGKAWGRGPPPRRLHETTSAAPSPGCG